MSNDEFDAWLASRVIAMSSALTEDRIQSLSDDELDDEIWTRLCDTNTATVGELDPHPRAVFTTQLFEWEVGNGGLHQFFYNHPAANLHRAVAEGYELLQLNQQAEVVRRPILTTASDEREWRESLRSTAGSDFFDSYKRSRLPALDQLVSCHDSVRIAFVRSHASFFTDLPT